MSESHQTGRMIDRTGKYLSVFDRKSADSAKHDRDTAQAAAADGAAEAASADDGAAARADTAALQAPPVIEGQAPMPAQAPRAPRPGGFLAIEQDASVTWVALSGDITHIGRGLAVDIRLDDMSVSRRHAILIRDGAGWRIVDDRSVNGVWLNGRRVSEARLHDGDVLVLGEVALRYAEQPARSARARSQSSAPLAAGGAARPD